MSDFKSENPDTQEKLEHKASEAPASEVKELVDPNEAGPKKTTSLGGDWKARLASMKLKAVAPTPVKTPPPSIPAPVHSSKDEKPVITEEPNPEVKIGEAVIEQEKLVAKSDVVLNAEALFYELSGDQTVDDRELFKQVFIARVNGALGLSLDQIRDQILAAHQVIFNERIGIQALLAYRAELLKDASAEEREKRLKEDFKFKAPKVAKAENAKAEKKDKGPKKSEDPFAQMRRTMISKFTAKGMSPEDAAKKADAKIAALKGDD